MVDIGDLREQGNKAFKEHKFAEAVLLYDRALQLDGTNPILHHNKALCYLREGKLLDSLRSVDLALAAQPGFSKALSTRGTILLQLQRPQEALQSYRRGVDIDNSQSCIDGVRHAEVAIGLVARRDANLFPPTRPASPEPAPASLVSRLLAALRLLINLLFVQYVWDSRWYAALLGAVTCAHALSAYEKHGMPTVAGWRQWLESIMLDSGALSVLLPAFLVAFGRPNILAILSSQAAIDCWYGLEYLHGIVHRISPAASSIIGSAGDRIAGSLAIPSSNRAATLEKLLYLSALSTIAFGLLLLAQLLTPARNFLAVAMIWQLLQMQFTLSPYTRKAFTTINSQIEAALSHRFCPAILLRLYSSGVGMAYDAVTQPLRSARSPAGTEPQGVTGMLRQAAGRACTMM